MIDLYYWPTPNGHKITMFLEESGLDYRIVPVDISAGDQFKPEFLAYLMLITRISTIVHAGRPETMSLALQDGTAGHLLHAKRQP